ncbi:MAG: HIT domain-containing protein [Caulobacteraceae bacterium]|nr:HIT domain-containing protein [Caulobacteraceae bacterium]
MTFETDPRLIANSTAVAAWPLCDVRLMDDARFPWLVLIPRVAEASELDDLAPADRPVLMAEMIRAGEIVRRLGQAMDLAVDKVNTAALGNVTAQLHVHVVGRRRDDPLWPDPIWGRDGRTPLGALRLAELAGFAAGL